MNTLREQANPWIGRLPIYEPGKPIEEVARELGFASESEIDKLASNENALGPSPRAVEAMAAAAVQMHRYPDGGSYFLRQVLAGKLGVSPDQILPTHGSNEALELLGHVFLGPETGIVMAAQAFVVYRLIAAAARASVVAVPMRDMTHDLDAMLAAIRPETRIVFVSNPNNPTSTIVAPAALDRFMDRVPAHVVVCFDEAYIELLPPDQQPDTLRYVREDRNVYILRTFSKTYGLAGLRLGYAVAPASGIELLQHVRQPFNVNALALAACTAALDDDAFVEKTRILVRDGIRYLEAQCRRLKLDYVPASANFILIKVGKGRPVFEALMGEGVIVRPMDGYGLPDWVRVTVGTTEENRRFVRALETVLGRGV